MKIKIVPFALFFFLMSMSLSAQYKPLVIGISFNPGLSWVKPDNPYYTSNGASFSYSYGIDLDFYFKPNYAFSTGIQILNYKGDLTYPDLYSPSGNNNDWQQVTSTSELSYMGFHLPAYLKLKSNPIGYNSFFAEFGFSVLFPFRASQNTQSEFASGTSVDRGDRNIMDQTNFASINLLMGVGIEIPLSGDTKIQITFRYLNGMTSLSKASSYRTDENGQVSTSEIANGGQASGDKESYYLKNLSLNFKINF